MRTMYDSIDASQVPANATMVAGYVGGTWPSYAALVARFPEAVHVSIAVNSGEDAQVLDVESGDATPADVPAWCQRQRARGQHPSVYCSADIWPAARQACRDAGVSEPSWWIAHYDNDPTIPPGAVAKQYQSLSSPNIDISSVLDYWPGVDGPATAPQPRPLPAAVSVEMPATTGGEMHRVTVVITTDSNGDGWVELNGSSPAAPAVPYAHLVSCEAEGSYPPVDGYWHHVARAQERDGYTCVSVTGGPPNSQANATLVTIN
jgi:hypothetical protein